LLASADQSILPDIRAIPFDCCVKAQAISNHQIVYPAMMQTFQPLYCKVSPPLLNMFADCMRLIHPSNTMLFVDGMSIKESLLQWGTYEWHNNWWCVIRH
jgi:hypothetical protein